MLVSKVRDTINKYNLIEYGDSIVVGVSGGPDSMTLLNILLKLKDEFNLKIYVAHINHGIRENAIIDEEYVKEFCEKNRIELFVKHADVIKLSQNEKTGLEETGRNVRYTFFKEILKKTKSNKIAIAHNLNDKIETIIMNVIRGTGKTGLKGIEPKRDVYIRPLIEITRSEIEDYCNNEKLNPRHDESNDDNTYTRNKIRNIIIPYLKENFNPNIIESINRLSDIIVEDENYLEEETEKIFNNIVIKNESDLIEYNIKGFNTQKKSIQKRLIILGITKVIGNVQGIEKVNIDDIIKLCNNNIGNKFLRPNKNVEIGIKNKKIYITSNILH